MKTQTETQGAIATVTAIIDNLPVGSIMPYGGDAASLAGLAARGWFPCDGRSISKSQFDALFAVIGDSCGPVTDVFRLPDMRGMFLRGVDGEANVDPDRNDRTYQADQSMKRANMVLSRQADTFSKHKHNYTTLFTLGHIHFANVNEYWQPAVQPTNVETAETGGNETRPKNVYVYYIIFAGLPRT